jgi:hypothetical protein
MQDERPWFEVTSNILDAFESGRHIASVELSLRHIWWYIFITQLMCVVIGHELELWKDSCQIANSLSSSHGHTIS